MNIIVNNKITAGLVSIALAAMVTITFATTSVGAQSQDDDEIAQLQAEAARLADLIRQLEGTSTVPATTTTVVPTATPTAVVVSNAACPYTWSRNLTIGSTGDDVLRLQRFLNGNPSTRVSTSGAGSPGSETSYYGPATARAVSAFQELHRAQILTPLNLTRGTGGFYPSTRRRANELCATPPTPVAVTPAPTPAPTPTPNPGVPAQPSTPSVSGDAVAISTGPTIGDAYALLAAQRVPFTSFVLTAGNDDVRVGTIHIRRVGLSSRDNLDSVAIVDTNGIQYGSAKSLNSRDEVSINAGIELRARESRTFAVVGNITTDPDEVNSGATVGFEIFEVTADTSVSGLSDGNTIRGATHVISTAIDLQSVEVTVDNQSGDVELNEQNEVVVVTVDLQSTTIDGASADEEDAYLKSLILEQKGSADAQEIGSVSVLVEGDEERSADIMVLDDQYIIVFDGKGLLIEENDEVEISLEVEPTQGSGETVKFVIEDSADVYLVGAATEYGLPVQIANDGGDDYVASDSTISAGTIGSGGRISGFDDEVRYGDNIMLGALSVQFEGEEIVFEDVSFSVTVDGLTSSSFDDADEDEITIDDIRLTVDGEVVARGDSIEIDRNDVSNGTYTESGFDFDDSFEITARAERDVEFGIVGDLNSDWSYFDGARIEFTFTGADTIEGLVSDKDYTDSGEYFATDRNFEEVTVRGNQIDFEITAENVDDTEFVAGAGEVIFATLEVDARDTSDDIEIQNLYITFEGGTSSVDLGDSLSSCEVVNATSGDRVADVRGSLSGSSDQVRFRFNRYVVDAESRENLNIICDIDTSATVGNTFTVAADTGNNDRVEYAIGRDNIDFAFSSRDVSEDIEVAAAGDLDVSLDIPDGEDESGEVLALGSSGTTEASLIAVTLEAESEDVRIHDIYLTGIDLVGTTNQDNFETVVASIDIGLGNTGGEDFVSSSETVTGENESGSTDSSRGSATFSNYIQFEDVNEVVQAGDEIEFDLTANFRGISDRRGTAGEILDAANLVVVWEGVDSGTLNVTDMSIGGDMRELRVFPAVPVVEADDKTRSFTGGSNKFLYEFTVNGSGGDIYLAQVAFDMSTSSNTTVSDLEVRRGSSTVLGGVTGSISDGVIKVAFDDPEEISESSAKTFRVYGDVTTSGDDEYINIGLAEDSSTPSSNGVNYAASIGNLVWSPNALENDGATTNNLDWFSGYLVFEESEVGQWDNER